MKPLLIALHYILKLIYFLIWWYLIVSFSELKFWFVGTFKRSDTNEKVTITYDASNDYYILMKSDASTCIYLATSDENTLLPQTACPGFDNLTFTYKGVSSNDVLYERQ